MKNYFACLIVLLSFAPSARSGTQILDSEKWTNLEVSAERNGIETASVFLPSPPKDDPKLKFILLLADYGYSKEFDLKTISLPLLVIPSGVTAVVPLSKDFGFEVGTGLQWTSFAESDAVGYVGNLEPRVGLAYTPTSLLAFGIDYHQSLYLGGSSHSEEIEKELRSSVAKLNGLGFFVRIQPKGWAIDLYSRNLKQFGVKLGVTLSD